MKRAKPVDGLRIYQSVLLALGWIGIVFYDWSDGFIVASLPGAEIQEGIGGPMSGLVGGVLTAIMFTWANYSFNLKHFVFTAGGWALGFIVGGFITWNVGFEIALNYATPGNNSGNISSLILLTLISGICGAFAGWVGGIATLGQLSKPSLKNNKDDVTIYANA